MKPWGVWPLRAAIADDACGHARMAQLSAFSRSWFAEHVLGSQKAAEAGGRRVPRGQGPREGGGMAQQLIQKLGV